MPSDRARLALFDIRDHVQLTWRFLDGVTSDDFAGDPRTIHAVVRCPEIIAEASSRLPGAMRDRHPHLPWRAIMGVGTIYRHDYDEVDAEFAWRTARMSLAPLLAAVEEEIAGLGPTG